MYPHDVIWRKSPYSSLKRFLLMHFVCPGCSHCKMWWECFPLSPINTRRKVTTYSIKVVFRYYFIILSMRLCKKYINIFELFSTQGHLVMIRYTLPFYCIGLFGPYILCLQPVSLNLSSLYYYLTECNQAFCVRCFVWFVNVLWSECIHEESIFVKSSQDLIKRNMKHSVYVTSQFTLWNLQKRPWTRQCFVKTSCFVGQNNSFWQ